MDVFKSPTSCALMAKQMAHQKKLSLNNSLNSSPSKLATTPTKLKSPNGSPTKLTTTPTKTYLSSSPKKVASPKITRAKTRYFLNNLNKPKLVAQQQQQQSPEKKTRKRTYPFKLAFFSNAKRQRTDEENEAATVSKPTSGSAKRVNHANQTQQAATIGDFISYMITNRYPLNNSEKRDQQRKKLISSIKSDNDKVKIDTRRGSVNEHPTDADPINRYILNDQTRKRKYTKRAVVTT